MTRHLFTHMMIAVATMFLATACATGPQHAALASVEPVRLASSEQDMASEGRTNPMRAGHMQDKKFSKLGILFHTLEVPAFEGSATVPRSLLVHLRSAIMKEMADARIFDHVVPQSSTHENTLILKGRVVSWNDDTLELSLAVDTRCGCRLGEALGTGVTQVTSLDAGASQGHRRGQYDLMSVAQGAVQYVASVMGIRDLGAGFLVFLSSTMVS